MARIAIITIDQALLDRLTDDKQFRLEMKERNREVVKQACEMMMRAFDATPTSVQAILREHGGNSVPHLIAAGWPQHIASEIVRRCFSPWVPPQ